MKKIINGKKYDTDTAKLMGTYTNGISYSDFEFFMSELYKKKTGEFFLYQEGGPMSIVAVHHGNNTTGSERIIPISENEAKEWVEKYMDADEYENIFGEVEE